MFKVFAFLKRNTALISHDEYRAGHIGYHSGHSRRLKGLRGYCVNVWSNGDPKQVLGPLHSEIVRGEPAGFTDLWDGFPAVYFDSAAAWAGSSEAVWPLIPTGWPMTVPGCSIPCRARRNSARTICAWKSIRCCQWNGRNTRSPS